MCLGLLALKKLRVNQIPDVEQPVMVVTHPLPRRLARDGRARDHQPHREVAAEHPAGLPDPLDRLRRATRAGRHHLQLQEEHGRGRRRDPQRDRLGAPQAAGRDARADPAAPRPGGAADHAAGAVVDDADARRDLAPGRGRARRPLPRHRRRGGGQRQRRAAARALGAAARREAARVQRLGHRGGGRAARAEHHRAGRQGAAARSTTRASAWSAASSRRREFEQIVVKRRGNEMVRLAQVATVAGRLRRAGRASAAQRQPERRHVDHALARRQHRQRGRARSATLVAEINKTLPRGHQARGHADGGKDAAEQPEQRDRGADLRRRC